MSDTIPASVRVDWVRGGEFDAGHADGPRIHLDSSGRTGPGLVDTLLCALGGCVSVDVVDILAKRRTPVETLSIDVQAQRVTTIPRRVASATLNFDITGTGIERVHAERAIDLAINKYCSVRDSLREDIPVGWTLKLNGDSAPATTPNAS
jgi:putative redox protein